ncbi:hypothetical protein HBB16_00320 [Pseudonocardia sp. MCCB 268]|nr:hypothetical protein [Pseudonocardia cytotoxica]
MQEAGMRVVTVSDTSTGAAIARPAWTSRQLQDTCATKAAAWPTTRTPTGSRTRTCSVIDIGRLVPAAMENAISGATSIDVRARFVVEGANDSTSPAADKVLDDPRHRRRPDILANAGGVIVSYLEWVQNLRSSSWTRDSVELRLQDLMGDGLRPGERHAGPQGACPCCQAAHAIRGRTGRRDHPCEST